MRLAAAFAAVVLAAATSAAAKAPVVVELFTSQGCGACADASAFVAGLAERKDVLTLTYSVDYWDYLGWRDTFAKPEFTQRQSAYVKRLTDKAVYTPQVIVDGHAQTTAGEPGSVEKLLREAARTPRDPPQVSFMKGGRVAVGAGAAPKGGAEVWLIRYNPRSQAVEIRSGENRGKTITYRNVVQELTRLGPWTGRSKAYRLPPASQDGLQTVVLVQQAGGGRVLALAAN